MRSNEALKDRSATIGTVQFLYSSHEQPMEADKNIFQIVCYSNDNKETSGGDREKKNLDFKTLLIRRFGVPSHHRRALYFTVPQPILSVEIIISSYSLVL